MDPKNQNLQNQPGQPGYNANLQPGQPGYNANLQPGQPGYNANLQPGQPGYNANLQPGQPGYNANLQPGQPGYNANLQPNQPVEQQGQSFLSKVENTIFPGGRKSDEQAATVLENQPGFNSNVQPGQSGYNANLQPGQPGYNANLQPGQPGYNANLQPGQPGYNANLQPGQPGYNANLQPGQPGYNANLQPGQPGYNANLQPGQPGYQPPGQSFGKTISQSVQHAFGQSPMAGETGYVAGQPLSGQQQPGQPGYNANLQPGQPGYNANLQPGQPGYVPGQASSSSSAAMQQQPGMMPAGYASYGPPSRVGFGRPTIMPTPNFNPNMEAERVHNAIKGASTSDSTIIDIFGSRTSMELKQIDASYKTMFGSMMMRDLEYELKLSGSFMKILNYRFFTLSEFDAHNVHKSITGPRTDENALIEIFTTRNNQQIREAVEAYKRMFSRDLEKDVIGDTSGNFKNLMTSLIQGNRDESGRLDQSAAVADANVLYNAGQGRWGTDDLTLNNILSTRSYPQLNLIFNEYSRISKYDIEQSIDKELSGSLKVAMLSIIKSARDRPGLYAERLYNSMKGIGTDERSVNRIIVSRCEIDLEDIKQSFSVKFNKDLNKVVEGDTKGDYQRILLQILGNFRTIPTY